jgi:bla regulator protein blaR1
MKAFLLAALAPLPLLANDAGSCLDLGAHERSAYVISDGDGHTMCGDVGDVVIADGSRSKGEQIVWFRIDDATWVIRDPAVTAEARRLFDDVNEIGRQQGVIGAKQGRIGAEQARIGMKQASAALRNETAEDDSARMRELGDRMSLLGREQSKYGEQQSALGEKMRVEIAAAQKGLSLLLDRAMKDGTAVRVIRL